MNPKSILSLWFLVLSVWVSYCAAIGMRIPPTLTGDTKHYSSLKNLGNCLGYLTSKDDIILVTIASGDKLPSQQLNLHVFDSESNILRSSEDVSQEVTLIFTNLNNPVQLEDTTHNILDRLNPNRPRDAYKELMDPHHGKSYIYICFDNIYHDKSWSFKKQSRDIDMRVQIRNMTTFKDTNYNNYAKHFNKVKSDQTADENNEFKLDFNEEDFETAITQLTSLLKEVSDDLKSSQDTFNTLMEHEYKLRDANEAIYSGYTRISLIMIACICIFGLLQIVYFQCYFKRHKII